MLEGRTDQLVTEISQATGVSAKKAHDEVLTAIDRWVWMAGWSDKLSASFGSTNPVSGPYYNFTIPEPQGVIAVAPAESFLAFIDAIAPAIVSGNTVVALVPGSAAIAALMSMTWLICVPLIVDPLSQCDLAKRFGKHHGHEFAPFFTWTSYHGMIRE
jgi:acyl-CoA reductase-like NAD-dependent aldehyde dehydrogenase